MEEKRTYWPDNTPDTYRVASYLGLKAEIIRPDGKHLSFMEDEGLARVHVELLNYAYATMKRVSICR